MSGCLLNMETVLKKLIMLLVLIILVPITLVILDLEFVRGMFLAVGKTVLFVIGSSVLILIYWLSPIFLLDSVMKEGRKGKL